METISKTEQFSHAEVAKALRKFSDLASDVEQAYDSTWADRLRLLFHHSENDPIMQVIMEPVINWPFEDFDNWLNERWHNSRRPDNIPFPTDETQQAAFYYHALKWILAEHNLNHATHDIVWKMFARKIPAADLKSLITFINKEVFKPFRRTVGYQLQEIEDRISGKNEVKREALYVFNNHGTYIGGDVNAQGSQVAIGGSQISDSSINNQQELAARLKELEKLMETVPESERPAVQTAINYLAEAATKQEVAKGELVTAVESITKSSKPMTDFLKDLTTKTVSSMAANCVVMAIKFALGIPL